MIRLSNSCLVCLAIAGASLPARAATVAIEPVRDGTLYESATGDLANGAGDYLFSGVTAGVEQRRAVFAFDVANALPAGSTVTSVTLTLYMSKTIAGDTPSALHRLTADWGEGASDAPGFEGSGTTAEADDATWVHRFYDTSQWTTPGGDFAAVASATQTVGGALGPYDWGSTTTMVADVQGWLDAPASNFGWILLGDESTSGTAKQYISSENADTAKRPLLTIEYSAGAEPDADFNADGQVDGADFLAWQQGFGIAAGALPSQGDADGNGAVDAADLAAWQGQYGAVIPPVAVVPEPSAAALATLAALAMLRRRRSLRV